jgi:hypothetical protein
MPLQPPSGGTCWQHAWLVAGYGPPCPTLDAPVTQPANEAVALNITSAITQAANSRLRLFIGEIIPYVTF